MRIYVNEQELDATMSEEKNMAEVYDAVSKWTTDNRKYILNLKVDSVEVSVKTIRDMELAGVDRVDFYIGDGMDMILSTLSELDRYIDQIGSTLYEQETVSPSDVENIKEGVHWIEEIMSSVAAIVGLDAKKEIAPRTRREEKDEQPISIETLLQNLNSITAELASAEDSDKLNEFIDMLRSLKIYVSALRTQIGASSAGREELLESIEEFELAIPELSHLIISINENFNAGDDIEALKVLENISFRLNRYIASLFALDHQLKRSGAEGFGSLLIAEVSFNEKAESFMGLLRDLTSALEENDITAAGDILEYELAEQLRALLPYLPEIRSLAGNILPTET